MYVNPEDNMDELINELNLRENVFDFIKNNIESRAKLLYTKNYDVEFLFDDLLNNQLSDVITHFHDRIDANLIVKFTRELAATFDRDQNQDAIYFHKDRLDSFLERYDLNKSNR